MIQDWETQALPPRSWYGPRRVQPPPQVMVWPLSPLLGHGVVSGQMVANVKENQWFGVASQVLVVVDQVATDVRVVAVEYRFKLHVAGIAVLLRQRVVRPPRPLWLAQLPNAVSDCILLELFSSGNVSHARPAPCGLPWEVAGVSSTCLWLPALWFDPHWFPEPPKSVYR